MRAQINKITQKVVDVFSACELTLTVFFDVTKFGSFHSFYLLISAVVELGQRSERLSVGLVNGDDQFVQIRKLLHLI